jgi:hypothetical protein
MTRRTRRLLLLGLPAIVAVALVTAWLLWPRMAITRENAAKVQLGLTLAEAEVILGGPARDETTGPVNLDPAATSDAVEQAWVTEKVVRVWEDALDRQDDTPRSLWWKSNNVALRVRFDPQGCVSESLAFPMRRVDESPLAMLHRWLGL